MLGAELASPRELWIACHGYRQLASRFVAQLQPLDDGHRRIVAPEALSRFYVDDDGGPHGPDARVAATWMTREDRAHEIADYVDYLDALHAAQRSQLNAMPRTIAMGFSQGAATAARWAAFGGAHIDVLVLAGGGVPPDLDVDAAPRLRETRVLLLHGDRDGFFDARAAAAQCERLARAHIDARAVQYTGGHRLEPDFFVRLQHALSEIP